MQPAAPLPSQADLDRILARLDRIAEAQVELRIEVAALKVKSGVWGLLAGSLPAVAAALWFLLAR